MNPEVEDDDQKHADWQAPETGQTQDQAEKPTFRELLFKYVGGDIHVHREQPPRLGADGYPRKRRESDYSLKELDGYAQKIDGGTGRLQFLVMADHAVPEEEKLLARQGEVNRFNAGKGEAGPRIIGAVETDIVGDQGEVNVSQEVLRKMDFAIASFHQTPEKFSPEQLTTIYRGAMANADIDCLGHPSRDIGAETLSKMDWDAILQTAASTHTAIELDTWAPLPDWLIKKAVDYKVPIMIGTDFHNLRRYRNLPEEKGMPKLTDAEEQAFKVVPDEDRREELDRRLEHGPGVRFWRQFAPILETLYKAGAKPEQIISSSRERLDNWLSREKAERRLNG